MARRRGTANRAVIGLVAGLFALPGLAAAAPGQPWMNAALTPSQRADLLLAAMTPAEKMAMVSGGPNVYIGNIPANSRLGIPPLNFQDGPAGPGDGTTGSTAFPAPIALAASWDQALVRQYGVNIGQEEHGKGGNVLLGPNMNLARVYQNGRNFEAYGEDPYLSSVIAAAHVQGIQSQGVITNIKHFVCNEIETDRWLISSDVDERTLHEIYYAPFLACVRSGAGSMMASYNRINGRRACESEVLNAVVKKQWGFDGFINSDWASFFDTVTALQNGLDIDMFNGAFSPVPLGAALQNGQLTNAELDSVVHRILATMFCFGFFDKPSTGKIDAKVTTPAHADFARESAIAGTVLLKNARGLLPLKPNGLRSIAVIGSVASTAPLSTGMGSANVALPYNITPLAGITKRAGSSIKVSYQEGKDPAAAAALAKSSDVAIVCVGQLTMEGTDRGLALPDNQDALISAVAAANPNTIVVMYISSGTLMPWASKVAGILVPWYSGQENGNALAQILFGDANPSARLPVSIPAEAGQVPTSTPAQFPGVNGHAVYSEALNIGYRWFDANKVTPLFPFGYGLSYTTFAYRNLTISPVSAAGNVRVAFDLTNTGTRPGAETPQLYLGFPAADGEPPKILKAFTKVKLQPRQSQHVVFDLDWEQLAHWDAAARGWIVTPGEFQVYLGASSRDLLLTGAFTAGEAIPASDLANAALHRTVTASSNAATPAAPGFTATDGNPDTGWVSLSNGPQWIMVDLAEIKDLARVRLRWGANPAIRYAIQISPNATTWTTAYTNTNGAGGVESIALTGRARYLRLYAVQSRTAGTGYTLQEFEVYARPQQPFGGKVTSLPGKIQAEDFDLGGESVAYHKTTPGTASATSYRPNDDVAIQATTDEGAGNQVGSTQAGDWLEYTVQIPDAAAIYKISFRVASTKADGRLRIRLDGRVLGTAAIPNTGGAQTWQTITLPNVPIDGGPGSRALRLEVMGGGVNLNWIDFTRVEICGTQNLALNQTATSSSTKPAAYTAKGGTASSAFDGDPRSAWTSTPDQAQWLMVDLGAVRHVARIRLDWQCGDWKDNGYGRASYSKSFDLQFSNDGSSWTNIYSTTTGCGALDDLAVSGDARYVRVNSTAPINATGVALYEVEVFGAPSTPAPAPAAETNSSAN